MYEREIKTKVRRSWGGQLLAYLALVIGFTATCHAAGPPGWSLVWSDDFDHLDTDRWTLVDTNKPTNKSLQDYLPEQVGVRDGRLVITADDRPSRGLSYRSGQVISKQEQKHGRWEVRAKLPGTRGTWPAIWLLPAVDRYRWPSGGEIDIVENRGDQPTLTSSAFHYGGREPFWHKQRNGEQQTKIKGRLANYHDAFHVYAADWDPGLVRYYVDGVHHLTVLDADVNNFLSHSAMPMQLVINNAIGGTFLPEPDETSQWPQEMEVDWVRVYRRSEPFAVSFTNGGFEASGGSLAGWSVFGNRLADASNVCIVKCPDAASGAALKLFGDFAEGASYSGVAQGVTVTEGALVTASLATMTPRGDALSGTQNTLTLKIEFYSQFGSRHAGANMLGEQAILALDHTAPVNQWRTTKIEARAPAGTVEARVSVVYGQPKQEPGTVYVDNVRLAITKPTGAEGKR